MTKKRSRRKPPKMGAEPTIQPQNPIPVDEDHPIPIDEDSQNPPIPISFDEEQPPQIQNDDKLADPENPSSVQHIQNPNSPDPEKPISVDQDKHPEIPQIPKSDSIDVDNDAVEAQKAVEVQKAVDVQKAVSFEEKKEPEIENPNPIEPRQQSIGLDDDDEEEQEGMMIPQSPSVSENRQITASNLSRRTSFKRRKPWTRKQKALYEKNLQLLKEKLNPIPFVPEKKLDFAKHEELLKRLGLWEFLQIKFDREIRSDLLVMLIASYVPGNRCGFVNDNRVMVNRADFARALKLPVKKDKSVENSEFDSGGLSEEGISFIIDFVHNWILLHEDTWMMPKEILVWMDHIRNGQILKVDWAGMIWFMVEKELTPVEQLGSLYYASHLQQLMKYQNESIFEEEPVPEVSTGAKEVSTGAKEETVDMKTECVDDFEEQDYEKQQVELCLGQQRNETEHQFSGDDAMDFQEFKEEPGDPAHWDLNGKNNVSDLSLRRCNLNDVQDLDSKDDMMKEINEEEEEEEEEEARFDLSSKGTLEVLTSADLLQGMGTMNGLYSPSIQQLPDHSSEGFFQSRVDAHLNQGDPSFFGNAGKRELVHEDVADHQFLNEHHKRMRHDGQWDGKSADFELCMEQISSWMSRARVMYAAKEQECLNGNIVVSELEQHKNSLLVSLEHKSYELQKRLNDNYKLEHELHNMSNLLEGYRKALKETRRAFSEYRERNPEPEEPLYKDAGPGGVVLSTMELEKQRLAQEEEEKLQRRMIEQMLMDFQAQWLGKLETLRNSVHMMGERLTESDNELQLLKETLRKRKMSETQGCVLKEV